MRQIGTIRRLQVQLGKLKKGTKPRQYYDPGALRVVPALRVTAQGVIGLLDGQELLDVHHAHHPYSRNRSSNSISFNVSAHYVRMRDFFGTDIVEGCAGENILIATNEPLELTSLSQGLIIETDQGKRVQLSQIQVAHPCVPFSRYALNPGGEPTAERRKEVLQFLDGGTRGFYCVWQGEPTVVRLGDPIFIKA